MKKEQGKKKQRRIQSKRPLLTKTGYIGLALIAVLTLVSFYPVFNAGFVNWDDSKNILENSNVWSLSMENIRAIFTETVIGNYNPLTILTFALEYAISADNPFLYHLDNVILHILNVFLVFLLARRLKLSTYAALFLTALYAIQPMRVESVAWITERKDVLFAAFYFASIHLYLSYKQKRKIGLYILSILLMLLACLSKIQAVTLPLSLLLIDMYMHKKANWQQWIKEKIPYFILALCFGLLGIYFLHQEGTLNQASIHISSFERFILGFYSLSVYLIKSLIPYEMVAIYPYPTPLKAIHYILSILGIASLAGIIYLWFSKHKVLRFGLTFFFVNIMFLLQFVGAGQGLTADRFTYIPYFGLFFIFAYFWDRARKNKLLVNSYIWNISAIVLLLLYSFLTFQQSQVWHNSETLWKHQLKYYKNIPLPACNLANYLRDQGRYEEAMEYYNESMNLAPRRAMTRNSRGKLYFTLGKYQQALQDYNIALDVEPHNAEYLSNKGAALGYLQQFHKSLNYFNKSIQADPTYLSAYANRAYTYFKLKNYEKAYKDFAFSLEHSGPSAALYSMMARCSRLMGQNQRALNEITQAISMNNSGTYYVIQAVILNQLNRKAEAKQAIRTAERMGTDVNSQVKDIIFGNK